MSKALKMSSNISNLITMGKRLRNAGRLTQIANVFARHGFWSVIDRIGIGSSLSPVQMQNVIKTSKDALEHTDIDVDDMAQGAKANLANRLCQAFEELGPAFIKFGQFLACREDLLSSSITDEFKKLHDKVDPLPYATMEYVLKDSIGVDLLAELNIDPKPVAAGSIGQVHKATLKDGTKVVIKIQKPNISEKIAADCQLMALVAGLIDKYLPNLNYLNLSTMVEEFERAILSELDYIREAGNTVKFEKNFEDNPHIVIPKVYWEYTNSKVIVLDYIEGVHVDLIQSNKEISSTEITQIGCEMFLQMTFVDGLLHGDLHPGNLLAQPGNKIAVLDFGIVIRLARSTRESLAGLLVALSQEDYAAVTEYFCELTKPDSEFDPEAFEHAISNAISPFVGLGLKKIKSGSLMWELAGIAAKFNAPLPGDLVIFLRTLSTFESIGEKLDPNFDLMESVEKYADIIFKKMYSTDAIKQQTMAIGRDLARLARYAPWQIRRVLDSTVSGKLTFRINSSDLERLASSVNQASSRMSISFVTGALIIGSSILSFGKVGGQFHSLSILGIIGFALAAILGLYIIWSLFTKIK